MTYHELSRESLDELNRLAAAFCEGTISETELARLAARLRDEPDARDFYLEYVDLHGSLFAQNDSDALSSVAELVSSEGYRVLPPELRTAQPAELKRDAPPPAETAPSSRPSGFRAWWTLPAAVAVGLAFCVGYYFSSRPEMQASVAVLSQAIDAEWEDGDIAPDTPVALRAFRLKQGIAHFALQAGAEIVVEGPAEFKLASDNRVELSSGHLLAQVPAEATGFTVQTPTSTLVDRGTEFGITVEADGTTEVHVFDGLVEAQSRPRPSGADTGPPTKLQLTEQQAARFPADNAAEPEDVPLAPQAFARVLRVRTAFRPERKQTLPQDAPASALGEHARIVFLGDSVTTGHTYILLIEQAIAAAVGAGERPTLINAGAGGNTSQDALERIERDVLPHRPTHVVICIGLNDAARRVPLDDYRGNIVAIIELLEQNDIRPVIATTSLLGEKFADRDALLEDYIKFLRNLCSQRGYRLADVYEAFEAHRRRTGDSLLEDDDFHPNLEGQQPYAQAMLTALGYPQADPPEEPVVNVEPGIIRQWRLLEKEPKQELLSAAEVAALKPDNSWQRLMLPQPEPIDTWWKDQERRRGFAINVGGEEAKAFVGVATVDVPAAKQVYFHTGGQLQTIWLNGARIYQRTEHRGWRVGRDRLAARLQPGPNTVVIEFKNSFFLSVNDELRW